MPQSWEAPNGAPSGVFAPDVVKALRARVLDAFYSLPKRGAEIGGLLMGAVLETEPLLVSITGFEEIPCQHRFGPSYILVDEDLPRLQTSLGQKRPDPVIGFFRSYTGREMFFDDADRNLLARYLPDASICLLIQPSRPAVCEAAFLFPENGEFGSKPRYPSFDFDEERLAKQTHNQVLTPVEAPPMPEQVVGPEAIIAPEPMIAPEPIAAPRPIALTEPIEASKPRTETEAALLEPRRAESGLEAVSGIRLLPPSTRRQRQTDQEVTQRKRHWLLPIIGVSLLSVGAAGLYGLLTLARTPRWAPLGLNARITDKAIHLAWNKNLRTVRDAGRGVLTIDDGSVSKRVELSQQQIRGGGYDYRPNAPDVLFRLELSGSGFQAAGDSLRVLTAPATAPAVPRVAPPRPMAIRGASAADREVPPPGEDNIEVPPKPLREIQPQIPVGIRARIHGRVVVPVEVSVAATGRVTSATSRGSGNDVYEYLSIHAVQAARQWRFSPARARDGKPAAASRIVYFVFTGPES